MSDLHVVAIVKAKAGSEERVGCALADLVQPSRAEEGCLQYELYVSQDDPATFVNVETWRSQADLDAHNASAHIAAVLREAGDAFDGDPVIHVLSQPER